MEVLIPLLFIGFVCGAIGLWFGQQRNRPQAGFWLGLFLGPFGWLLTLLLPADESGPKVLGGFGRCPTCGGTLVGPFLKCPHCASDVFWAGSVPTRTVQEAADEQQRQKRLAAERIEHEKRLAAERIEHEKRLASEREEAWRRWRERSRAAILAVVSAARCLVRIADRVLRRLSGRQREVRVRRAIVLIRRRVRKADWVLRGWTSRLRTLDEAGKGRCLQLLLAILLILVIAAGGLAVGKYQEYCRQELCATVAKP